MAGLTGAAKILQVHPTRRCNLRCLHCYSSSGPEEREQLTPALLSDALADASSEGYTVASFSGGEPLLYTDLRQLLDRAHECDLRTTVTTNGTLLDPRRLDMLAGATDLVAISLDGVPASHDRIRHSAGAFERMRHNLEGLRARGIPFGFIFTLTQHNLDELVWVTEFALEQEARLLQIHPLERVGRAKESMRGERPDKTESAYAYLEVARLREIVGDRMLIHIDFADREHARLHPADFYHDEPPEQLAHSSFAELVSPLVIEPDGTVVPLQHGFARRFALGNLHDARLEQLMDGWRATRFAAFNHLCRESFRKIIYGARPPIFNWYEMVGRASESIPNQ